MKRRPIVHYPCGNTNPYNRLLTESLAWAGVSVEMRTAENHANPARSLRWAWGAELVHFHWLQGLYVGRSWWRFAARSFIFLLVLAGLRLRGTRLVVTVHNLVPHEHRYRLLHRFVNVMVGRLVHRLLVHSEPALAAVAEEYRARRKLAVIEHIDYGEPATSLLDRAAARQRLAVPLERTVLLFFGSIRPYKGVDHLIAAAKRLDAMGCDIVIAGRPHTEAFGTHLRTTAGGLGNVHLRLGELRDEQLSEYLVSADVVAFPYKAGLSSGAAHLALSHGRPLICSRSLAFEHLVDRGIALPFEPAEPEDICRAVTQALYLDPEQWRNRVDKYRALCRAASVGPRLKQVYEELLSFSSVPRPRSSPPL